MLQVTYRYRQLLIAAAEHLFPAQPKDLQLNTKKEVLPTKNVS